MSKATYSDKLRDPRWQKKRLQILERDDWACQWCGNEKDELHVHHLIYRQGADPWDYPDTELLTLCKGCHETESANGPAAIQGLLHCLLVECKMDATEVQRLANSFKALVQADLYDPADVDIVLDANTFSELRRYKERLDDNEYNEAQEWLTERGECIQLGGMLPEFVETLKEQSVSAIDAV